VNSRKDIEEIPCIFHKDSLRTRLDKSFWKRLGLQKIKFFYNVKAILEGDSVASLKENFVKYLWGMRRLKTLRIFVKDYADDYNEIKWFVGRLERMEGFLCRLENLSFCLQTRYKDYQGLIQNKIFFSYVTELSLESKFDPLYVELLQVSKNLKSFFFDFWDSEDKPGFVGFLAALGALSQLKELGFSCAEIVRNFWSSFKPPSPLRSLSLKIDSYDLMYDRLFRENIEGKDAIGHWKELTELEFLKLTVASRSGEMQSMRRLIGMILKKTHKLRFLTLAVTGYFSIVDFSSQYESFIMENMSHIYESLEAFEYSQDLWNNNYVGELDLKLLRPFRNLKKLKLHASPGTKFFCENVEEAVYLLEENQKEDETPVLEIQTNLTPDQDWLGESLKKIEKIKRKDKNLRLIFNLKFVTKNFIKLVEKLCQDIQAAKAIKGLEIDLDLESQKGFFNAPVEKMRKVLSKYRKIDNLRVFWKEEFGQILCVKFGDKIEFYIDRSVFWHWKF